MNEAAGRDLRERIAAFLEWYDRQRRRRQSLQRADRRRLYGAGVPGSARREVRLAALAGEMPGECHWGAPGGGFFVWLGLPAGLDSSAALLPAAEASGVSCVPGARFCSDGGGQASLRLAFSLLSATEMTEGARRLGAVIRAAVRCAQPLLSASHLRSKSL